MNQLEKSSSGKVKTKGQLVGFDLSQDQLLWTRKYRSGAQSSFTSFGKTFDITDKGSTAIDIYSGEELWEIENNIYYINGLREVVLGYRIRPYPYKQNVLQRINPKDGSALWDRDVSKDYGWQETAFLNDSTFLIAADGLYAINLNDGSGWKYEAQLGKKDYTNTGIQNAAGIAFGAFTGVYVISGGQKTITNVCSNILVDSSFIYFASKQSIIKLNANRDTLWQQALPKDQTSSSYLFLNNGKLFMINRGYALVRGRPVNYGTPYIASFDASNGSQNFLEIAPKTGRAMNKEVAERDTSMLLVIGAQVFNYSLNSGKLLKERTFKYKEYGELEGFDEQEYTYLLKDSNFISFQKNDPSLGYLSTSNSKVFGLNSELEIVEEFDRNKLYFKTISKGRFTMIDNGKESLIIDEEGQRLSKLNYHSRQLLLGNKLYSFTEEGFMVVELGDISR